jgi:hypothetical protein
MLFSWMIVLFATDFSGDKRHPFNCWDENGQLNAQEINLTTGDLLCLVADLRKNIGFSNSRSYIAKYFNTKTEEGKQEFWREFRAFHANMPADESLTAAHNALVQELTHYYQLKV